jgi:hypothetical protein
LYILKAILCIVECQGLNKLEDQEKKMEEGYTYLDSFENSIQRSGFKESHLVKLMKYASILQVEIGKQVSADIKEVEFVKRKLEKIAKILLRV